jgi:hypothetical protein
MTTTLFEHPCAASVPEKFIRLQSRRKKTRTKDEPTKQTKKTRTKDEPTKQTEEDEDERRAYKADGRRRGRKAHTVT